MIHSIRLQNYRSYSDDSFEFEPGVTIIVGPNASGKTNLLEAILVLARGSSYRVSDEELIMFDQPWARVDGMVYDEDRTIKLVKEKPNKSFIIGGKDFRRLRHNHKLPVVLFEPNHLQLLNGQPDMRRQYLDDLLEQLKPSYGSLRLHYKRVLAQRNALLKHPPRDITQQLFVWNVRLCELGGAVATQRIELTRLLNEKLGTLYKAIAGVNTEVSVSYQSKLPPANYESSLFSRLESSFDTDLQRGFTTYGPHRDDLIVTFNGKTASTTASRGEIRTVLLAFKILELEMLEKSYGKKPMLLLDDVFSELDGHRRHALTDYLKKYQTFITTTDADLVGKQFVQSANLIALG